MTKSINRYKLSDKIIHTVCTSPPEVVYDFMEEFLVNQNA